MKKTLFSIICILILSLTAFADNVSEPMARSFAGEFLNSKAPLAASAASSGSNDHGDGLSLVYCGSSSVTKAVVEEVPFYVYNRNKGGYVIISGVDNMMPVVAYSAEGSFDPGNINPEFAWWLSGVEKTAADYRNKHIKATAEVANAWLDGSVSYSTKSGEKILLSTPAWYQNAPFNCKCPDIDGSMPVTGCVPTAIAEVMCYHGWPEKGSGTLPAYSFTAKNKSGDEVTVNAGGYALGTEYDWESLKNVTSDNASGKSTVIQNNLGQLIADVGQAIKAVYGISSTGGNNSEIIPNICTYFGYRKDARYELRDLYDYETWYSMIVTEIKENRPVIYSGQDFNDGGHCFVFDGVDTGVLDLVHINIGWGVGTDSWVNLGTNFYGNQDAIFGFRPDDGSGPEEFTQSSLTLLGGECFSVNSGSVSYGSTFDMNVLWLSQVGTTLYDGKVKLVQEDRNGNIIGDASGETSVTFTSFTTMKGYTLSSCHLPAVPSFGDRLVLYQKKSSETDWTRVRMSVKGESSAMYPLTGHARIVACDSYSNGDKFYLRLDNTKYSYMYSYYSLPSYDITGCLTGWEFYVDGALYKTIDSLTERYIDLDKAGKWTVRCYMISIGTGDTDRIITASFTVE